MAHLYIRVILGVLALLISALLAHSTTAGATEYTKAGGAENCDGVTAFTITTAAECTTAGAAVGYPFEKTVADRDERPAGCFWDQSGGSYFNSELDASATWSGVGAICKTVGAAGPFCRLSVWSVSMPPCVLFFLQIRLRSA